MNREPSPDIPQPAAERPYQGRLRRWEVVFLLMVCASLLTAIFWQSRKEFFDEDELCTALLVSNPSFSEMWHTIRHGGETNPPLYFVIEWGISRLCGNSELALRTVSGLSVALAAVVLFFTVRPLGGPRVAALAVALIFGLSRDVFFYGRQARYYALLLLLVSLGAYVGTRFNGERRLRGRDYLLVFLIHLGLVYLHAYGALYSGALLVAMVAMGWVRGRFQWGLYGSVLAAWAAFGVWVPSMLQQLRSVSGGVFVPPNNNKIGYFFEELALQLPLAPVFVFIVLLAGLALLSAPRAPATKEAEACFAPVGWCGLAVLALALMAVPLATWMVSWVKLGLFMQRYLVPCTAAWVFMLVLILVAVFRLPPVNLARGPQLSPRLWNCAFFGVLAFCCAFQPVRAWKNPPRPAAPFTDADYGYKDLPIVCQDTWAYFPRAFYGHTRPYLMLTDDAAGKAAPGWTTQFAALFFKSWYPRYNNCRIVHYNDLPEEFLALDSDEARTFEYLFAHHPELQVKLLGTRPLAPPQSGSERMFLVHKPALADSRAR